jgi:hypothetical protein
VLPRLLSRVSFKTKGNGVSFSTLELNEETSQKTTFSATTVWKYVNVRRLLIFIEQSIEQGLRWVVSEPNSEEVRGRVFRSIDDFLIWLWRALPGNIFRIAQKTAAPPRQ